MTESLCHRHDTNRVIHKIQRYSNSFTDEAHEMTEQTKNNTLKNLFAMIKATNKNETEAHIYVCNSVNQPRKAIQRCHCCK